MKCWAQTWTESERGWGQRPDGYTLHKTKDDITHFLNRMRTREAEIYKGQTPDEYSFPDSPPTLVEITDKDTIDKLNASTEGIWGPGNSPPPPLAESETMVEPPTPLAEAVHKLREISERAHQMAEELVRQAGEDK